MRVQIIFDLHLESGSPAPDLVAGVDIVVLAGDIAAPRRPDRPQCSIGVGRGAARLESMPPENA